MTNLQLSYRTSKLARKSLYDDVRMAVPPDGNEAMLFNELTKEFGAPCSLSLPQVAAILAVITCIQEEEIAELNAAGAAVIVPFDPEARVDN